MSIFRTLLAVFSLVLLPALAAAQDFPAKPIVLDQAIRLEKVWDGFEEIIKIGRRLDRPKPYNEVVMAWNGLQEESRPLADDVQPGLLDPP